MEDLIQNLKRLREDRNISYIMLERATGIRAAKLREIEEGQQQPTIAELDRLLAFYSITSQQLMRYKGKRQLWLRYSLVAIVLLLAAGIAFFAFGGSLISSQEPGEHDALSNRANEASIAEAGAEQPSDELSERSNGAGSIEDASRSADADAAEVGGDGADGDEALEGAEEASSVSDEEQADQAAAETDTEAEQAAEAVDGANSDASTERECSLSTLRRMLLNRCGKQSVRLAKEQITRRTRRSCCVSGGTFRMQQNGCRHWMAMTQAIFGTLSPSRSLRMSGRSG